jgi:DNA-binding MarR family transcriptional regulator
MGAMAGGGDVPAGIADAYLLLARFSRSITALAEERLGRGAISNRDVEVLMVLRHGARSPSDIAEDIGAVRASISRTLRRLQASGLVTTAADKDDGRAKRVALSRLARRRIAAFAEALGAHIDAESGALGKIASQLGLILAPVPVSGPSDALGRAEAMARTGDRYQQEANQRLERWGLAGTRQRHAVAWLWARGGERPVLLAEELALTSQATSALVDHLAARGLVERTRPVAPDDQRAVLVMLTPDGEEAARDLLDVFAQHRVRLIESIVRPA